MRNFKGQFASKRKLIFNTLLILSMIALYCGYAVSTKANDTYLDFNCDMVAPVSCDSLHGIDYKPVERVFWITPPTGESLKIKELESQLNKRYEDMTIEQKIKHVFGEDGEDAIRVFKCESGLQSKCNDGLNSNGSVDCGIAQINSIHGVPRRFLLNEDVSLQVAKQIFDQQGWNPWVCKKVLKQL